MFIYIRGYKHAFIHAFIYIFCLQIIYMFELYILSPLSSYSCFFLSCFLKNVSSDFHEIFRYYSGQNVKEINTSNVWSSIPVLIC